MIDRLASFALRLFIRLELDFIIHRRLSKSSDLTFFSNFFFLFSNSYQADRIHSHRHQLIIFLKDNLGLGDIGKSTLCEKNKLRQIS